MADHELKDIAAAVASVLTTALASYTGISISRGQMRPGWLPTFTTYAVRIAPAGTPWTERTVGVRYFQMTYRFELFAMVKVTDEDLALWGETADAQRGIFQLVRDIKDILRGHSLSGLLDNTYEQVLGDVALDQVAVPGFETADRVMVHRAKVPYTAKTRPFCVPV